MITKDNFKLKYILLIFLINYRMTMSLVVLMDMLICLLYTSDAADEHRDV